MNNTSAFNHQQHHQSLNNNGNGLDAQSNGRSNLAVPSFSFAQSQTYSTDATDEDGFPIIQQQQQPNAEQQQLGAQQSKLHRTQTDDSSTFSANSSTANMSTASDAGSGSAYSGKSARYKSAMTSRARQRRMRRMKERTFDKDDIASPGDCTADDEMLAATSPGGSTSGIPPTSPTSESVARAKEHVEQMRLEKQNSPNNNSIAATSDTTPGPSNSSNNSTIQQRYLKRLGERRSPVANLSRQTSGGSSVATANPTIPTPASPHVASQTITPPYNKSLRKKKLPQQEPKPEDYIPDWNTSEILTSEDIQNASNYTKLQFQMANIASENGEVEMFSDDGMGSDYFSSDGDNNKEPSIWEGLANPNSLTEHTQLQELDSKLDKQCWQNDVWSDATTPSILNRTDEIFHQKAAANIVKLLTPERMLGAGLMAPEIGSKDNDEHDMDVIGDSPTGVVKFARGKGGKDSGNSEATSRSDNFTFDGDNDPSSSRGGEWKGMTQVNRVLFRKDLDDDVKQSMIFQAFRQNMIEPSDQLTDLLSQIHRKNNTTIDRAFATRRKNACGALKILSAKDENRIQICWTLGVLPAIASVLSDTNAVSNNVYSMTYAANTEARNRIVGTLLNLSVNKKNRMLIVNTPGVLESMVETIKYDEGEGRQGCYTVLLYLAKTAEARKMIVKSAGMLECLSKIIEVPAAKPESPVAPKSAPMLKKKSTTRDNYMHDNMDIDTFDIGRSSSRRKYSASESECSSQSGYDDDERGEESSVGSNHSKGKMQPMDTTFESTANKAEALDEGEKKEDLDMYDADPNRFLHGARLSAFACLLCLVKSQENAVSYALLWFQLTIRIIPCLIWSHLPYFSIYQQFLVARDVVVVESLIGVSERHMSPSHARAMAILAHLTRHPKNCHHLIFKYKSLLPMLQSATGSPDKETCRYAFCALQNLSMDKSCRAPIAHSPNIIWSLTQRCKMEKDSSEDETRTAAIATLQNLADEPANLIQFTIVKDCIGTIIEIAKKDEENGEMTDLPTFMAKNTLVTLSHWFRKIATSGVDRMRDRNGLSIFGADGVPLKSVDMYNARLDPTHYNQWS